MLLIMYNNCIPAVVISSLIIVLVSNHPVMKGVVTLAGVVYVAGNGVHTRHAAGGMQVFYIQKGWYFVEKGFWFDRRAVCTQRQLCLEFLTIPKKL